MKEKRVLIVSPSLRNSGGVAHYYRTLQQQIPFEHSFFTVGVREDEAAGRNPLRRALQMLIDYLAFLKHLLTGHYNLVLLNPSMNAKALSRDYVLFLLCKIFRKKTVIFFRGWDPVHARAVFEGPWRMLYRPLATADAVIVLASTFADTVKSHLPDARVFLETTVFDERVLPRSHAQVWEKKNPSGKLRLLFLSRLEANKGVYEVIEAYKVLRANGVEVELIIAGTGSEDAAVASAVRECDDPDIRYVGQIGGAEKADALSSSSILLFPSTHAEGMPNSVLEGMGSGLAILSTRVGGLGDFFEGAEMGGDLAGDLVTDMVAAITRFAQQPDRLQQVSEYNYAFAQRYFYSSTVVCRLDRILEAAMSGEEAATSWLPDLGGAAPSDTGLSNSV